MPNSKFSKQLQSFVGWRLAYWGKTNSYIPPGMAGYTSSSALPYELKLIASFFAKEQKKSPNSKFLIEREEFNDADFTFTSTASSFLLPIRCFKRFQELIGSFPLRNNQISLDLTNFPFKQKEMFDWIANNIKENVFKIPNTKNFSEECHHSSIVFAFSSHAEYLKFCRQMHYGEWRPTPKNYDPTAINTTTIKSFKLKPNSDAVSINKKVNAWLTENTTRWGSLRGNIKFIPDSNEALLFYLTWNDVIEKWPADITPTPTV